jgi:6-phosphofructokinase 1
MEYIRDLGYCAAQFLLDGGTAAMVSIHNGRCTPIPFTLMVDPVSGRAKVGMVDITAQSCQIARQCMIRLSDEDFKYPVALGCCAALAGLSPEAFRIRFQPVGSNVRGTQKKGGAT